VDDDRPPDRTSQILMDFVRQVSEEVVFPPLTAGHHEPGRRRPGQAGRILAITFIAAVIVGVVALAVVYGPRSSPTGPRSASTTQRAVFVPTSPTSHGMLKQVASIMKARLHALGDNHVSVTVAAGSIDVSGPVNEADVRLVGMRGTFYVRPVLCGAPPYSATPPGGAGPAATTTLPGCATVYQTTITNLGVSPNANAANGFTENTVLPDPAFASYPSTPSQDDNPLKTVLLPGAPTSGVRQYARFLLGPAELNGSGIASVHVQATGAGSWIIDILLNPSASAQWDAVAYQNFHKLIGIDVDGQVLSAPLLQPAQAAFSSFQGQIQIAGNFTSTQARGLVALLESGPLPVGIALRS